LSQKNSQFELDRAVFTLPSVEVGSILEYRYEIRYPDNLSSSPDWEIQRPYFVHKAHFAFTPFREFLTGVQNSVSRVMVDEHGNAVNSLIWWPQLPAGVDVKKDQIGHFSLDVTDIPAAPHEQWMPPINSFLYHVAFYYKSSFDSGDFWISEAKRWSKDVDRFADPSKPIREAVAGVISPADSDLEKARKLYKAVQALDNTDFSRKKGQSELRQLGLHETRRAEDTWSQKSGSPEDIALLYLAMLRAAGLTAWDMKVVDRDRAVFAPGYLSFGQLQDDVVILSIAGKEIVLDPGEKMCPFQVVHWKHTGAGGIRQSADGRAATSSPLQPYTANTLVRVGDLNVDDHGAASGNFRFLFSGQRALDWRQEAIRSDEDETKKSFDRWLKTITPPGIEAHIDHFAGLDEPDANLIAFVKVEGTPGSVTSTRLLLPGFLFEPPGNRPFIDQPQRQTPVDMHYAEQVTDQVVFHLPPGLKVEAAPQESKVSWTDHAVLATKIKAEPAQITIARQLSRAFVLASPDEYPDLHAFFQKVAAADQQQLVLTRAPAARGN
jgi:hypothetical protein